ncbi:hypothetical protein LJ737_03175 [Hymenobacter sp. 15J16-1T3B]|uniref:hypothetical protein n=1 Tax=Hymenobacter sp. 15J16-1T3B TaxID=2886941 RepID=UPI001D102261|nr:hypothetical protein [Hymenobacter sp. 15J16-1T3B]MCC3156220.1 hypothetical protein [Hymenobacter sp. 15J16-1T3B]
MKLLLQTAALMSLLLIGTERAATAQEPAGQPVSLDQVADCVYLVRVSNPAQVPGRLQLVRATDGAVLYEQASTAAAFGQKLNVSHLADGRYAVVVKLGPATHRFALDLHTTQTRSARLISLATPGR